MSKNYKSTIVKLMTELNLYKAEYNLQIKLLDENLQQLDKIKKEAEKTPLYFLDGDVPKEHPVHKMLTRERTSALTNLRELGLTPKGLRMIKGIISEETTNMLEKLLDDE